MLMQHIAAAQAYKRTCPSPEDVPFASPNFGFPDVCTVHPMRRAALSVIMIQRG
jgi:hypothetical protein